MNYNHALLKQAFFKKFKNVNRMRVKTGMHPDTIRSVLKGSKGVHRATIEKFASHVDLNMADVEVFPKPIRPEYPVSMWPIKSMDFRPRLDPRKQKNPGTGRELYIIVSHVHLSLLVTESKAEINNFRLVCENLKSLKGFTFEGTRWVALSANNNEKDNPANIKEGKTEGYWLATTCPPWSQEDTSVSSVTLSNDFHEMKTEMGFFADTNRFGEQPKFDEILDELRSYPPEHVKFTLEVDYTCNNIDQKISRSYDIHTGKIGVALDAFIKEKDKSPNRFKLSRSQ